MAVDVDFVAVPTVGWTPFTVNFTDLSVGEEEPTNWLWDFGDGTTSTNKNPVKTYSHAGIYTVSLTVDGSTETKVNYIIVNLVGIRQKTNYIQVIGILKTWDYGPPPERLILRMAMGTGNANIRSISKGGTRISMLSQESDPIGSGFSRTNGPTILFD